MFSVIHHIRNAPLYNIILILDTIVTQKQHIKQEKYWIQQCRHLATMTCVTDAWLAKLLGIRRRLETCK